MNEFEQESFEQELRRLDPAKLPDDFARRLAGARPDVAQASPVRAARSTQPVPWLRWLRWFAPAAGVGAVALVLWLNVPGRHPAEISAPPTAPPAVRADDVQIDRQLVAAFDAIATLPDGEPVRVRCQEWMDEVVLRDTRRGVAIQRQAPRFEIIPVSYETF